MRLLLDTHTFFWSIYAQDMLSSTVRTALESELNESCVSIASAWEMAIKVGLGKWPQARALVDDFESELSQAQMLLLPITLPHVRAAGLLPSPHRDPFDRLLAAQAMTEGLTLVTVDARLQGLGAPWMW